jgi:magnesium-transporting ATPase (P-type)
MALVKFSQELKMKLSERSQSSCSIVNAVKETENYEIMHLSPFTSSSKKMGVLVRQV